MAAATVSFARAAAIATVLIGAAFAIVTFVVGMPLLGAFFGIVAIAGLSAIPFTDDPRKGR